MSTAEKFIAQGTIVFGIENTKSELGVFRSFRDVKSIKKMDWLKLKEKQGGSKMMWTEKSKWECNRGGVGLFGRFIWCKGAGFCVETIWKRTKTALIWPTGRKYLATWSPTMISRDGCFSLHVRDPNIKLLHVLQKQCFSWNPVQVRQACYVIITLFEGRKHREAISLQNIFPL